VRKRAHEIGTWNSTGLQCGFGRGWTTISPFNSTALDIVVSITPDGKVFRIHSQRKERKAAISGDLSGRYVRLGKSAHGIRVSPRDAEEDATRRRATADVYRGSSGARTRITWTDRIARVEQREDSSRYFYGGSPEFEFKPRRHNGCADAALDYSRLTIQLVQIRAFGADLLPVYQRLATGEVSHRRGIQLSLWNMHKRSPSVTRAFHICKLNEHHQADGYTATLGLIHSSPGCVSWKLLVEFTSGETVRRGTGMPYARTRIRARYTIELSLPNCRIFDFGSSAGRWSASERLVYFCASDHNELNFAGPPELHPALIHM